MSDEAIQISFDGGGSCLSLNLFSISRQIVLPVMVTPLESLTSTTGANSPSFHSLIVLALMPR